VYEKDYHLQMVMELLKGGDLYNRIRERNTGDTYEYTEESAKKLAKNLIDGVSHLHENGILHRDLKPHVRFRYVS
jgi:serine/threonine protein kinase